MNMILSCILMENIIMAAFTYLFPSAGLPRRTSSSSTYFVCSWFFQMLTVIFFYFCLEAVNTMHITKLQTFSTGNRTLKREVLFHYCAKNLRVIRKPEEAVASPKMDLAIIGVSVLWHNICCTCLKFLCKLSCTEHYWSGAKYLSYIVHSLMSSLRNTWAQPSISRQETGWYYALTRTCSSSCLSPACVLLFSCKHDACHKHQRKENAKSWLCVSPAIRLQSHVCLATPLHELWVSCGMWQRGKRRGMKWIPPVRVQSLEA